MATRKATRRIEYKPYGQGFGQEWQIWGEYSDTKTDTKAFNEDMRYLKDNNLVRVCKVEKV